MNKLHERVWSCLVPLLVVFTVIGERSINIDRDVIYIDRRFINFVCNE